MKEYGIALCFNKVTESKLSALQASIQKHRSDEQTPSYTRPHITLAVVEGSTSVTLEEMIKNFSRKATSLEGVFNSVGSYPTGENDIYLSMVNTSKLRHFHQQCLTSLEPEFVPLQSYHQPDYWNPHCTVAYSLPDSDMLTAFQLCRNSDVFRSVSLVEIVIVGPPAGTEIASYLLGKESS